jgi:hypothetical protein|tara:strand:+ start:108 stop:515 length:408 start_codon:yes stop_codon:yes gene_type:complete
MKENKVVRYDRTKNKVVVNVTQVGDILEGERVIGHTDNVYKQAYNPNEMKRIYAGINAQIVQGEKQLKDIKLRQTTNHLKFDYDELVTLKAKMAELKTLDQMEQDKQGLENIKDNIKRLKKDALQLKPIIEKLRK